LASSDLGTAVIKVTDDFFAPASRMLNPEPAVSLPDKFVGKLYQYAGKNYKLNLYHLLVETGQWMDGWESKRHNQTYDW
jgi:allantoicase